ASLGGLAVYFLWPQRPVELPPQVAQGRMGNVDDLTKGAAGSGQSTDAGPQTVDKDAQQAAIDAGGEPPPFNPGAATTAQDGGGPTTDKTAGAGTGTPGAAPAESMTGGTLGTGPELPAAGDMAIDLTPPASTGVGEATPGDATTGAAGAPSEGGLI